MTSPHDKIDDWLGGEVTPLYPPPGSLDRIRRRARQRKTRQVVFTAAGCAVVIGTAIAVPNIAFGTHQPGGPKRSIAGVTTHPTIQASGGVRSSGTGNVEGKGRKVQQLQHTTLLKSWTAPPSNFQPTSVTVVGNGPGFIAAVIGQAGVPGHCASVDCTSIAGTYDYGTGKASNSWFGVSAPYAPGPSGGSGVSELRFANTRDGWAFGPALQATSVGGLPWHPQDTYGKRVVALEATGSRAFAVFAQCAGHGSNFASRCTSFSLYTSTVGDAGRQAWTAAAVPTPFLHMSTGQPSAADLVLGGGTGYLLTPSGQVLSASLTGGWAWKLAGTAPCKPAAPQVTGEQTGAQLASGGTTTSPELFLTCEGQPGSATATQLYTSPDGATWTLAGDVPVSGAPTSLASDASRQVVLATTTGISYSADGGKTWQASAFTRGANGRHAPDGGFSYVGMTDSEHGVAVPVTSGLGEIYVTTDAGQHWRPSPITG
ncbi:MAG TPA: hypothetical protein VEV61_10020 [Streptosporangiaceae bacterium]|nr:hypothetical protein [Streptosporangiaceae bacterium]